jgi:cytochrome c1
VPANVTEYWHGAALRRFIRDPSSIRHGSRMPSQASLSEPEIEGLLAYLVHMKRRKVESAH